MFKLAVTLGKSVREIEQFDSAELSEWLAYDRVDRLPDGHLSAGIIASTVANANRSAKGRAFAPQDFMPTRRKRRMSPKEIQARMNAFVTKRG